MQKKIICAIFMFVGVFASGCSTMAAPEYGMVTSGPSLKSSLRGASIVAVVERFGSVETLVGGDGKPCAIAGRFRVREAFKGSYTEFDVIAENVTDLSNEYDRFLLIGFASEPQEKQVCDGKARSGPAFYLAMQEQTLFPLIYDPDDASVSFLIAHRDSVFTPAPLFGAELPIVRFGADMQRLYAYLLWSDVKSLLQRQLESAKH
jgi:hypothetical protein